MQGAVGGTIAPRGKMRGRRGYGSEEEERMEI
jgi:hypothetical protein